MIKQNDTLKSVVLPRAAGRDVPGAAAPQLLKRWEWWFVGGLFVLSLALRLIYLSQIRENPFFEHPRLDALYHDRWAQSIAAGNILGNETFFRAPFYPYLLGTLYALFGHDYFVPRLFQHLLGALSVVLVFLLARRFFDSLTAIVASLLAATYAVLIYFEGELLFESLLAFLCLLWLLCLDRARERSTMTRWLTVGFVYGLICITRPPFLVLIVPLFGYEVWRLIERNGWKTGARLALFLLLGCAVPIAPITIRNLLVGNEFVLIASQGGVNFYIGNNPTADGYSSAMPGPLGASWENRDQTYYVEKEMGRRPTPGEESWFWYRKGIEFIREQPARFAELLVKKVYLFWNGFEIPNNQSFYSFVQYSSLLEALPVDFRIVGPLALLGMVMAWTSGRSRFTILFILMYSAVIALFFVCDRYRVPVIPLLCIFGAHTILALVNLWKAGKRQVFSTYLAIGVLFAVVVNSDIYGVANTQPGGDSFSVGLVAIEKGEYEEAIKAFEQCTAAQTYVPNLFVGWGVAELMRGNKREAVRRFRQELHYNPRSYAALANLAFVHYSDRTLDSALAYSSRAIAEKPYVPVAYIYKAQSLRLRNGMAAAEKTLRDGLKHCGDDFLYGEYLLAGMHAESGDPGVADSLYRSILQQAAMPRQPRYEPEFSYSQEGMMGESIIRLKAKAHYGLGGLFAARGQLDSSIGQFRVSTLLVPDLADAWADLGVALLQTRRYSSADSALHRALGLDSANYLYWYNYGTLLGITHRFPEAREAFERALRLRPDFAPAQEKLAITKGQLGE